MTDESGTLCTSCNMCCDGTLFFGIALQPAEVTRMREHVDFITPSGSDTTFLRQACRQLGSDGACKCYQIRPKGCIDYKCDLLNRIENSETDLPFAQSVVQRARQLLKMTAEACDAATPEDHRVAGNPDALTAFRALKDALAANATVDRTQKDEAFFQWTVSKTYLTRHFQSDFGELDELVN